MIYFLLAYFLSNLKWG